MSSIGARLVLVEPGEVHVEMPFSDALTQQNGFLHAGIATTLVDSACGYSAMTLVAPDVNILSVEFKVNLLAPGRGDRFLAIGKVVRSGRTLTVCAGEVWGIAGEERTLVALMQATMMSLLPTVSERSGA